MKCPSAEDRRHAFDQEHSWSVRALLPALNWHDLWADEEEEEWLLYPLIPARRLIALFSAAKTGKSLLMLEIAAALSTGRKVLGHDPGRRIRVLYIDFENDPRGDVRTRLQDMGYEPVQLDHLDYLSFPSLPYLDSEAGASALLAAVETYGPELVVIDTISRAVGGEENDNDTWLNLYKHTGLALKRAKVAMVRLDHSGKDEAKGQRGGSAKAGDIDAIWKLTTEIEDQRFRLHCLHKRFQLDATDLTLLRFDHPALHHTLQDSKPVDDREAKILNAIELANRDKVSTDVGRDKLKAWGAACGLKLRNDVWSEVVRRRKNQSGLAFEPFKNLSPTPGTGQNSIPVPSTPGQVGGNGHFPLSELSPTPPGQVGTGPTPDPVPVVSTPGGGATGQGTGPRTACVECGWDRFHKAACSKNPTKRVIEEEA